MIRYLIPIALALSPTAAFAQSWTTGARPVVWAVPPVIGDGNNSLPESSTATQGGDPPALAYEPAAIDENGNYTRADWLTTGSIDRIDNNEAKFRTNCNFSHFAADDPILAYGQPGVFHHHTFIGNKSTNHSSTYQTLRNNPASTCAGGPLNATAYWEPTMFKEIKPGVSVPIKPDQAVFYYVIQPYSETQKLYRLLRGKSFVGGVNPSDPTASARLAEIPDGQGWDKTNPITGAYLQGWDGFICYKGTSASNLNIVVPQTNSDDPNGDRSRVLVNANGTDPWAGACTVDGTNLYAALIADVVAPSCWDGHNLTSPNGRDHFRYPIRKTDNSYTNVCPQGWWKVPHFIARIQFSTTGWSDYSKWYLSSDRHGLAQANWKQPGSTFHFDWMNGWDSVVMTEWLDKCVGVTQNGDTGEPLTCGSSTISATSRLKGGIVGETPPVGGLSNNPILTAPHAANGPSKNRFGKITSGTTVSSTTVNHSGH